MAEVSLELQEILALLGSLETRRAVERYMRNDAASNFRFLTERIHTYDAEAAPEKRSALSLEGGATELALAVAWALDGSFDTPKSRRTRVSWVTAASVLKEGLFFQDSKLYVLSETEAKSQELLDRMEYMLAHVDDDGELPPIRALWSIDRTADPDILHIREFMGKPHNAEIQALPQGGGFRQFGASAAWIDEAGLQRNWRRLMQQMGPACRRLICTGTINENAGYTERCGRDELKQFRGPELGVSELPAEDPQVFSADEALRVFLRIRAARREQGGAPEAEAGGASSQPGTPARRGAQEGGKAETETRERILRIARGLHYWIRGERDVFRIHYRSTPERDNDSYLARLCSRLSLSADSPEVQVEMEIDPEADFGERRFPGYNEDTHVREVQPIWTPGWECVVGGDYGYKNPTSFIAGSWNGHWLRLWYNHYYAERIPEWHKAHFAEYMRGYIPGGRKLSDAEVFGKIRYTICDPSGANYAAQYAQPPAWPHITTFDGGGIDLSAGINNRRMGLSASAALLDRNGCCEKCQVITIGMDECSSCGKPIHTEPGVLIDPSLVHLRHQLRTLRYKEVEPGQKIHEEERSKDEDHAADGFQYLCNFLRATMHPPDMPAGPKPTTDEHGRRLFRSGEKPGKTWQDRIYG